MPAVLKILSQGDCSEIFVEICEGKFHQVKRMFASVGCKVTYLKRISMGTLTLGTLEKATYRKLTEQELASLKKEAENGLGAQFALKDFHSYLLRTGPAPFSILQAYLPAWTATD